MGDDFDKITLTQAHFHEVCDRAYLLSSMFETFIVQHVAVMGTPRLQKHAETIAEALAEFYQVSGQEMFDFDEQSKVVVDVSSMFAEDNG